MSMDMNTKYVEAIIKTLFRKSKYELSIGPNRYKDNPIISFNSGHQIEVIEGDSNTLCVNLTDNVYREMAKVTSELSLSGYYRPASPVFSMADASRAQAKFKQLREKQRKLLGKESTSYLCVKISNFFLAWKLRRLCKKVKKQAEKERKAKYKEERRIEKQKIIERQKLEALEYKTKLKELEFKLNRDLEAFQSKLIDQKGSISLESGELEAGRLSDSEADSHLS